MGPKVIAATITLIANIAIGVLVFTVMLISMNGYSGDTAQAGLIAYIVLALATSIAMSFSAFFLTEFLIKKEFSGAVSALIAVPLFSILGGGIKIACMLIGVGVAEFVRVKF